jgi:hypothetical protein
MDLELRLRDRPGAGLDLEFRYGQGLWQRAHPAPYPAPYPDPRDPRDFRDPRGDPRGDPRFDPRCPVCPPDPRGPYARPYAAPAPYGYQEYTRQADRPRSAFAPAVTEHRHPGPPRR